MPLVPIFLRDADLPGSYNRNMGFQPWHDWFLDAWLAEADVTQTQLQQRAGWTKRKASEVVTGQQKYNRDTINDVCIALGAVKGRQVEPFELLLHPEEAMVIRAIRDSLTANQKAAERLRGDYRAEPAPDESAGDKRRA